MSFALRISANCKSNPNKCKKQEQNKMDILFIHTTTCANQMETDSLRSTKKCPSFKLLNAEKKPHHDAEKKPHHDDGFELLMHKEAPFWNSLIVNYVKSNGFKQALVVYETMQDGASMHLVPHTFTCLLKACAALKNPEVGAMLHVELARKGLSETNIFIGSTLVDMYAKCGCINKAQQVFDKLPNHNVVSWTSLIAGYNKLGFGHEAVKLVEKMHHAGLILNSYTFVCTLKVCGNLRLAEKGAEFHAEIVKRGLEKDPLIGNTTVDMYARCGLFEDAHVVLERLLPQDVVPWNALITGYIEQGKGEKAIKCYELMQHEGIAYDCITLSCCLKACGCCGAVVEGEKIYNQVCKTGMEKDHLINTLLVDMYAKCGSFVKSQDVLEKLSTQDAVSWTALILGYFKYGYHSDALVCFGKMRQEGISPNICTLNCILKVCENMASLEKGEEVYHEIVAKGFESDMLASNTLIGLYARCSLFATAKAVLEKLSKPDMFAWNPLIVGYVEHGFGQEALSCLEMMQQKNIPYDVATLGPCLKACSVAGATIKGHKIHAEICKKGFDKELLIGNYLIDMYCGCGFVMSAQLIMEKLLIRDIFSWNALLVGFNGHGLREEILLSDDVLNYTERMQHDGVSPNGYTYLYILKACGRKDDVRRGRELHLRVGKQGLEKFPGVCVALINFYLKCGLFEDAVDVFNRVHVKEVASLTAILSGYIEAGLNEKALNLFEEMQVKGILLDAVILMFVLKACTESLYKGQMMHAYIVKLGLERDVLVGGSLICLYAEHGHLVEAQHVFENLRVRDVVVWGALIAGYNEHGLVEKVLECSNQMLQEGVPWDSATIVSFLKACSCAGASLRGRELHTEIAIKGFNGDLVGNVLIDMYTKCGLLREALHVFDKLVSRDVVSWNAAITANAQFGEIKNAMASFAKMVAEGITPDWLSFMNALNACSHEGLVDEGWVCFRTISKGYGLVPRVEHYTCMADILGRAGLIEQAGALIDSMPLHPDIVGWTSVLGACQKWGKFELGRHVFDHAVLLDEYQTSLYVSMSNCIIEE